MDFFIICLPIPTIWSLQMNLRRKATIISVLSFGILSVTVAIIRLPVLISVSSMKTDASIDVGKMIIVASFEVQCAIVAVNLPAMKALWTKIRRRFGSEEDETPQESFKLSAGRKRRGDTYTNRTSTMGSVTRLERGLETSESKEELFHETDNQAGSTIMDNCGEPKKQSICVTTSVEIQRSPRASLQQERNHLDL